ncbi:MAG: GIY-YIG nuclease family protein [Verrucomicrobiota bacterium]
MNALHDRAYYVYILTNPCRSVFYTGVTNNIMRRLREHRDKMTEGFTAKYNAHILVYLEAFQYVADAIRREKQIKKGSRAKKIALVEKRNPLREDWRTRFERKTSCSRSRPRERNTQLASTKVATAPASR